jgi:hypothetical protein
LESKLLLEYKPARPGVHQKETKQVLRTPFARDTLYLLQKTITRLVFLALWAITGLCAQNRHVILITIDGGMAAYQEDQNLPLPNIRSLIRTGVKKGIRIGHVRSIDVAPTICSLLHLDPLPFEGRILSEALED